MKFNTNKLKMGYLSQKKHLRRESWFCVVAIAIMAAMTCCGIFAKNICPSALSPLHLYALSALLTIYTLWRQRYKCSFAFFLLFVVNFTFISANANIFVSEDFNGSRELNLYFDASQNLSAQFNNSQIINAGEVLFDGKYAAEYMTVEPQNPLTLIKVDFRNVNKKDLNRVFEQLSAFLKMQNHPVVLFGEFGIPAWTFPFRKMMNSSGLSVKNRILLTNSNPFNIFSLPGFYILGFNEMGIKNLQHNGQSINWTISFNSVEP